MPPSPEDITINIGRNVKSLPAPENHRWGGVTHNRRRVWTAQWRDQLTGRRYIVFPNISSTQRTQHMFRKLENAREFNVNSILIYLIITNHTLNSALEANSGKIICLILRAQIWFKGSWPLYSIS